MKVPCLFVPKYFEGYYCKDGNSVEGIKTENSRKVLQTISYAYPDGITAEEISQRINIPYDTVSASLTTLGSSGFIIREKHKLPGGRPKTYSKHIDSRAFKYYIENRNFALIEEEADQYAPGYTKYTSDFLYAWNALVEKHQQNEIYRLLINLLNGVMTKMIASNDPLLGFVIPMSERHRDGETSMLCKFCGINHEARDFIRAILLHLLDRLESTGPFIDFLQKNHFILKDSYGYNHLFEQAMNQQEPKKKQQAKEWLDNLEPDAKDTAELILKKKPSITGKELMDRVNIMTSTPYPDEDPGSYTTLNEHEALSIIAGELGLDPNVDTKLPDPQRQQNADIATSPFVKKIVEVEHSLTNRNVKVTINKVEFTSKYTRAFLKIENLRGHHESPVNFGFSAVLIQGKRQFGYVDRFKDVFPRDGNKEINLGSIPPGVEEQGVVVFQPVELTPDAPRTIKLRFDSSVAPFIFEVPLEEGEGERRPALVTEEFTTKVVEVNQTKTGGGIFVTLHKAEFSDHYTAAFLTVENKNSHDSEIIFLSGRIIQGKRQFGSTSEGPRYKHITVNIPGGIEERGVEKFEAIDNTGVKTKFEFQVVFVRTKEGYKFDFDVDVPR